MAKGKHAAHSQKKPAKKQEDQQVGAQAPTTDKYAAALDALAEPQAQPGPGEGPLFPDEGETDGTAEALATLGGAAGSPDPLSNLPLIDETAVAPSPVVTSAPTFAAGAPEPPRRSVAGTVAKVLVGLAVVVGAAYVGGATYLQDHFLPNTTLDGHDVSLMTIDEAATFADDELGSYTAHVEGQGLDLQIAPADAGLAIDTLGETRAAHDQLNRWQWPLDILGDHVLTTPRAVKVDDAKLAQTLAEPIEAINANATAPVNATMAYVEESGAFEVIPEKMGTGVDANAVLTIVRKGLVALQADIHIDESVLAAPEVTSDDEHLNTAAERANFFIQGGIELSHDGEVVDRVEPDTIRDWIVLDDDLNATFDSSHVTEWCRGPFSERHDTVAIKRTYTRPDGRTFTVEGGTYGWCVDGAALAQLLIKAIETGSREPVEIPFIVEAERWVELGQQDWGDTYIDLSISEQHMRFYVNGELKLESDVVTGRVSDNHPTPTGVYYINGNKGTKQKLIGLDEDGDKKPDYENEVDWWMPFINNMVAFHDASWRSSFGGQIYVDNGSHGCVNLPPEVAKQLYELAPVGTVVVVHD